jgi:hypothetical protein
LRKQAKHVEQDAQKLGLLSIFALISSSQWSLFVLDETYNRTSSSKVTLHPSFFLKCKRHKDYLLSWKVGEMATCCKFRPRILMLKHRTNNAALVLFSLDKTTRSV